MVLNVFVGNPGVGKSTLLNQLLQSSEFKSGVSIGKGLTTRLQIVEKGGHRYADTPGLSDIKIRKEAAEEISTALKQNGQYRIVFVCTVEAGRVRTEDTATMKLVLDALPSDIPYAIVVNKLSPPLYKRLKKGRDAVVEGNDCTEATDWKDFVTYLNSGRRSTPFVFLYPRNNDLEDTEDIVAPPWDEYSGFLKLVPTKEVKAPDVKPVRADAFEEERERMNAERNQLIEDSAKRDREYERQLNDLQNQIQDLQKGGFFGKILGTIATLGTLAAMGTLGAPEAVMAMMPLFT